MGCEGSAGNERAMGRLRMRPVVEMELCSRIYTSVFAKKAHECVGVKCSGDAMSTVPFSMNGTG